MAGHSQNSQAAAPPHRISMLRSGASSSGLTVTVDLSSVLQGTAVQRRALQLQCITIPAGLNDLHAFERLLRTQSYGDYLIGEEFAYLRSTDGGTAEVKDSTFSFRGAALLTVVPADPAYRDADMLCLPCGVMPPLPADILPAIDTGLHLLPRQIGASDSRNPLQQRASAAARAAGAADHITRQSGGNDMRDVSNGVRFADSLAAARDLPVAPTRADFLNALQNGRQSQGLAGQKGEFGPSAGLAGVLKDSEGRVMPAAAGLYDRAQLGERRTCAHCNILQWKDCFHPFVWDRQNGRSCVCLDCEARLKCSSCERVLSHNAFSINQKRYRWNGTTCCRDAGTGKLECNCKRNCNDCIGVASAVKVAEAAAKVLKRCGALQYILFFFWKKVWVACATERRLASQDAMAGLQESAETPDEDPVVTERRLEQEEEASAAAKAQALVKAGGLPVGALLELRSYSDEGVAGSNESPAGDVCKHDLVDQCVELTVDWKPDDLRVVVRSECDDDFLHTIDGDGVAGSVSVSASDAVPAGYPPGWIGVVQANTGTEVRRGSVQVFHGFCDRQEIECANGERTEVPTEVGYLAVGRVVRIVEELNDRVLIEDVGAVDCDMVTNYDMYLEFDDERTPRCFDDRGEDPDAYTVYDGRSIYGSGCWRWWLRMCDRDVCSCQQETVGEECQTLLCMVASRLFLQAFIACSD
jgi:hypothetical protein